MFVLNPFINLKLIYYETQKFIINSNIDTITNRVIVLNPGSYVLILNKFNYGIT